MKRKVLYVFLFICARSSAQQPGPSPMDALSYGVVLDHPQMKNVKVKQDVTYLSDAKGSLHMDIYWPPDLKANENRPAIIFLNALGDNPGQPKLKTWGIYSSWPKLMAANGYIGISMEADVTRIQESVQGIFKFISEKGGGYNIDKDRLGIYAASANVTQSAGYLMGKDAYPGIKAAVLYYGGVLAGPYRKDLPVLFVISEGDVARTAYGPLLSEVLRNNAPWTIKMATNMPHAFDAFSDNDEARKIIRETISFWKNNLDPVPAPSWPHSKGRDVLGAIQMDHPKALQILRSLAGEYGNDNRTQFFYAEALRQDSLYDEADAVYKKILAREPQNVEVLVDLASLMVQKNKPEDADQYIQRAISTGRMDRTSYVELGFSLLVANRNKEAATFYEKALTMQPAGRAVDYYNLGCAYAKYNEKDKAFAALNKAVEYGYNAKQQYETDGDLASLRSDSRYKELVGKLQ
ncbi:MAG: tetratricopeptide repeat protein [Chitinophagaceae bacterium]